MNKQRFTVPGYIAPATPGAISNAPKKRGFAAMTAEQQRQIASMGGRRAHENGTAHQWTSEEAREAAIKGQRARRARRIAGEI